MAKTREPVFGLGAVADSTQNYPVAQRTFRFVVGQWQMGMIQYPEDRGPIIEHFHRQRTALWCE